MRARVAVRHEMAVLSGALNLPVYETDPERYQSVRWVFRGYSYVDPQKEIAAQKAADQEVMFVAVEHVAAQAAGHRSDRLAVRRRHETDSIDSDADSTGA